MGIGDKVYAYLHKLRTVVRSVSESTAEIIEGWCGPHIFNDAFPLDRRDSLFVYLVKNMFLRKDLESPLTFIYF